MTRIRYKKISKNIYQSTKPIFLGQNYVNVNINVDTKTLTIYDGSEVLYNGTEKSFDKLRKKAREVLITLGANFELKVKVRI